MFWIKNIKSDKLSKENIYFKDISNNNLIEKSITHYENIAQFIIAEDIQGAKSEFDKVPDKLKNEIPLRVIKANIDSKLNNDLSGYASILKNFLYEENLTNEYKTYIYLAIHNFIGNYIQFNGEDKTVNTTLGKQFQINMADVYIKYLKILSNNQKLSPRNMVVFGGIFFRGIGYQLIELGNTLNNIVNCEPSSEYYAFSISEYFEKSEFKLHALLIEYKDQIFKIAGNDSRPETIQMIEKYYEVVEQITKLKLRLTGEDSPFSITSVSDDELEPTNKFEQITNNAILENPVKKEINLIVLKDYLETVIAGFSPRASEEKVNEFLNIIHQKDIDSDQIKRLLNLSDYLMGVFRKDIEDAGYFNEDCYFNNKLNVHLYRKTFYSDNNFLIQLENNFNLDSLLEKDRKDLLDIINLLKKKIKEGLNSIAELKELNEKRSFYFWLI